MPSDVQPLKRIFDFPSLGSWYWFMAQGHHSHFSVYCTIAKDPPVLMTAGSDPTLWQRPDSFGRFGKFGGQYVPETLMHALSVLETLIEAQMEPVSTTLGL
ncbi:hypothetical protein F2Q70_00020794 [Brassica cretica]|uniref:Uncharacterized protein n=1 Tax=Brassica cretica TaxID=69181 RepID=A0A8S9GTS9_BRACR|nr:hypothetical protein F2Q70_00020794 [Brassica cretica]